MRRTAKALVALMATAVLALTTALAVGGALTLVGCSGDDSGSSEAADLK